MPSVDEYTFVKERDGELVERLVDQTQRPKVTRPYDMLYYAGEQFNGQISKLSEIAHIALLEVLSLYIVIKRVGLRLRGQETS